MRISEVFFFEGLRKDGLFVEMVRTGVWVLLLVVCRGWSGDFGALFFVYASVVKSSAVKRLKNGCDCEFRQVRPWI